MEEESDIDNSLIDQTRSQNLIGDYNDPRRRIYPQADISRRLKALPEHRPSQDSPQSDEAIEESDDELNGIDSTATNQVMKDTLP